MKLDFEKAVDRNEILHVRVSKDNKNYVRKLAKKFNQQLYVVVDKILDAARKGR